MMVTDSICSKAKALEATENIPNSNTSNSKFTCCAIFTDWMAMTISLNMTQGAINST